MKLYELADSIADILTESEDGELPATLGDYLDRLEMDFAVKADSVCRYRSNLEAEAAMIAAEIERLMKMKRQRERRADWLKAYLLEQMRKTGQKSLKLSLHSLSVQKSPMSVSWAGDDAAALPAEWRREIPASVEPDLEAARKAARAGQELPPGFRVVQGEHLRIS